MTPQIEVLQRLFQFTGALALLTTGMAWWRKDSPEEDEIVSAAADTVLDAIADGDVVNRIDLATGRNLRDQVTLEDAIEMDRERELRRFPRRN